MQKEERGLGQVSVYMSEREEASESAYIDTSKESHWPQSHLHPPPTPAVLPALSAPGVSFVTDSSVPMVLLRFRCDGPTTPSQHQSFLLAPNLWQPPHVRWCRVLSNVPLRNPLRPLRVLGSGDLLCIDVRTCAGRM